MSLIDRCTIFSAEDRQDLGFCFGAVAPYSCDRCGPIWSAPRIVKTEHESWGFWGGSPAEYEWECRECGGSDCGPNDDPKMPLFKVINRYTRGSK